VRLIKSWQSRSPRAVVTLLVLNTILLGLIIIERVNFPAAFSLWKVLKDFLTLNVAILALTRSSFETTRIKMYLLDDPEFLKRTEKDILQMSLLLTTFGTPLVHLAVNDLYVEKVRTTQSTSGVRDLQLRIAPRLLKEDGTYFEKPADCLLGTKTKLSVLLDCDDSGYSEQLVCSADLVIVFELIDSYGRDSNPSCSIQFRCTIGGRNDEELV